MFKDKLPLCDERVFEIRGGLVEIISAVTMALEILVEVTMWSWNLYFFCSAVESFVLIWLEILKSHLKMI